MNWLVNRKGLPGHFLEMDLMQEHFNFWLEDLADHKGKEFDEPFYRDVLSMNVDHFLQLKDEMEEVTALKARTKKHGSTDMDNEMRTILAKFRDEQVNCFRVGRNEAILAPDNFVLGMQELERHKIKSFITKSTITSSILRMHMGLGDMGTDTTPPGDNDTEHDIDDMDNAPELDTRRTVREPHHAMVSVDGDIYMVDPGQS